MQSAPVSSQYKPAKSSQDLDRARPQAWKPPQTVALADAQTLLNIRQSRLTASVTLIEALGGGWNAASLGAPTATGAERAAQEDASRSR